MEGKGEGGREEGERNAVRSRRKDGRMKEEGGKDIYKVVCDYTHRPIH